MGDFYLSKLSDRLNRRSIVILTYLTDSEEAVLISESDPSAERQIDIYLFKIYLKS